MTEPCIDAQLLAAFAERRLKRSEMPKVLAHLERCPTCMSALKAATDLLDEPSRAATHDHHWRAIAAAVVVVVGLGVLVQRGGFFRSNPADALVRLAPRAARMVEPRLSGGFDYAPYQGPMRSMEGDSASQKMKLVGAIGELVERADADRTAAAQQAGGIGLVLVGSPEEAIVRLRAAAEGAPANATAWSDLAAAEYATALREGRASLYPLALAHADRALRIDPNLPEALFNRALILGRLGLINASREAWNRYLAIDPSSKWAAEAREHLRALPASTGESMFRRDQPLLEAAAARGDQPAVDAFVARYPQQSRAWGEAEYLGRWAEAVQRGDEAGASQQLAVARAIGHALVHLSGESLLRDAVAAIDGARRPSRANLAEAHATYRRARIAYSRHEPAAAEPELLRAAGLFANDGDPMAFVARYFAANARFDRNDAAGARRDLEVLRGETRYAALGAQIDWELGLCTMLDDDWSATAAFFSVASDTFRRLGEKSNLAVMQNLLAASLISLGRPDEGWALRSAAFSTQSGEGRNGLVALTLGDAARFELRTGQRESASALLALEEVEHRAAGDDIQLSNALVREAVMRGEDDGAARLAREALAVAQRVSDPALRTRAVADAHFAAGVADVHANPRAARELLSLALDHYRATGKSFYVAEALLARARASLLAGDRLAASHDLEEGIAEVDHHRTIVSGGVTGTGVIDARRALIEELITLRLVERDIAGAFDIAERSHRRLELGNSVTSVAALQRKLAGSDAVVLELVVLPDQVVAFAISATDITSASCPIGRERVIALAAPRDDDDAARRLYDVLIRPSAPSLAHARQLIVVPDAAVANVAFSSLLEAGTNRRLIETMVVATALRASTLEPAQRSRSSPSLVALALPSGQGTGVALPESGAELAGIRALYGSSVALGGENASLSALGDAAGNAGVIHIAGHTERQPGAGESALLFGRAAGAERVTWTRIAAMKLPPAVVTLAACETLRIPPPIEAHALSLGGGFLAAGARAVIGTLAPIPDNDARSLFQSIHRQLARGASAAVALRRAQLEAIGEESRGHRTSWRSLSILTTSIEASE
jgi:CHAT domain-containing protein